MNEIAALAWFDWRAAVAVSATIAGILFVIAWQKRTEVGRGAKWLSLSALALESLGLALSLMWAVSAPEGALLPLFFVAGWVAMLVGRTVTINALVSAWRAKPRKMGMISIAIPALIIAYVSLFASGLFYAIDGAGLAAQQRLEVSRPAQALDAEIEAARAQLSGLAGYADAGRASAEESANAAQNAQIAAQQAALQSKLDSAQTKLAKCPANYFKNCLDPTNEKIANLQGELARLTTGTQGGYSSKHAEYLGLQSHIAALLSQRAGLSASGAGIQEAWLPEDRAIAWAFGISEEKASRVKWLVFTAIFDILGLLFHIVSAIWLINDGDGHAAEMRYSSLLNAGLSPAHAAQLLAGQHQAMPAMPSLDTGGRVMSDGVAQIHAGEAVLNPHATAELDRLHPGLVDKLNKAGRDHTGRGRPASGPADGDCVTAVIYGGYLSGAILPGASRDTVRKYLSAEGHTIANARLAECLKTAREQWKKDH